MNQRMSGGDQSLNTPMVNAPGEEGAEWQDWLEDERPIRKLTLLKQKSWISARA